MTTPTRTEFEAAAYRHIRHLTAAGRDTRFRQRFEFPDIMPGSADLMHGSVAQHLDTAIAAAMGWPTVPEVSREQLLDAAIERVFSAPTPKEPTP